MGTGEFNGRSNPEMDPIQLQGGLKILLVTSTETVDKVLSDWPLGSYRDFTYLILMTPL